MNTGIAGRLGSLVLAVFLAGTAFSYLLWIFSGSSLSEAGGYRTTVTITAVRQLPQNKYARPA